MKSYISILRGINVSGQKIIKMNDLQNLYKNLGFQNVTTYIQSGNVVFSYKDFDTKNLEEIITKQIATEFGFEVPVIVLTVDELQQIVDNNPFAKDADKEQSFLHVTFLASIPEQYDQKMIEDKKQNNEEIIFTDQAIYLYCPNGYGNTKLSNSFIENKLKVKATTRNWKTTNVLLGMAK